MAEKIEGNIKTVDRTAHGKAYKYTIEDDSGNVYFASYVDIQFNEKLIQDHGITLTENERVIFEARPGEPAQRAIHIIQKDKKP